MALDLYSLDQVLNILAGIHVAGEAPTAMALSLLGDTLPDMDRKEILEAYRLGMRGALGAVALAFGLRPTKAHDPAALPWELPGRSGICP